MKKIAFLATFAVILWASLISVMAQVTNSVPEGQLPPLEKGYLWQVVIALVTPLVIQLVKWVVPSVPKALLPWLTPVVGVLLGLAMNWLTSANLGWVDMGQAGALAVFVYDAFRLATKPAEPSTTNG